MTDEAQAGDVAQPAREADDDEGPTPQGAGDDGGETSRDASARDDTTSEDTASDDTARDDARDDPAEAAPAQKKRKKKKKKRRVSDGEPSAKEREGVPSFARRFPRDPELDRLLEAFDSGDYAAVRTGAERLASDAARDDVRDAARELRRRVDPDPLAVLLIVAAMALLAFLSFWYWSHAHAAG